MSKDKVDQVILGEPEKVIAHPPVISFLAELPDLRERVVVRLIPNAETGDSWGIPSARRAVIHYPRSRVMGVAMVAPIELKRRDVPASDLRRFARQLKTGREACRVLAIAMVLEGATRLRLRRRTGWTRRRCAIG